MFSSTAPGLDQLVAQAIAAHQSGQLDRAEQLYAQALDLRPNMPEIVVNMGLAQLAQGKHHAAIEALGRAIALNPQLIKAHYHLGGALAQLNRFEEAATAFRAATRIDPNHAEAQNNLGNALLMAGDPHGATEAYKQTIALKPGFAMAHNNLGYAYTLLGYPDEAVGALKQAIVLAPTYAEAHNNLGRAFSALARHDDAAAAFRTAIGIARDYGEAHANLSASLYDLGDLSGAEAAARTAVRLDPANPAAHNALGNAIRHQGRNAEAEPHYREALRVDANYVEGYKHLAMCLQEQGRLDDAFALFDKHAQLTATVSQTFGAVDAKPKQQHDAEQEAWLFANPLRGGQTSGARVPGHAVERDNPIAEVSETWLTSDPQIAVLDNLLTAPALASLRDFCLRTNAWRQSFERGYLGAVPESGFTPPIIAQIAEELRAVYPAIIGDHPLMYFWAFKYDSALHGIRVHADFAAVNVNFWVTADEANLDPEHGGLIVYDVAAPLDWTFERYNAADDEIRALIAAEGGEATVIPYRSNRAAIFDSDLFHETDVATFRPGYENRRVNVTLLFGRREDAAKGSASAA